MALQEISKIEDLTQLNTMIKDLPESQAEKGYVKFNAASFVSDPSVYENLTRPVQTERAKPKYFACGANFMESHTVSRPVKVKRKIVKYVAVSVPAKNFIAKARRDIEKRERIGKIKLTTANKQQVEDRINEILQLIVNGEPCADYASNNKSLEHGDDFPYALQNLHCIVKDTEDLWIEGVTLSWVYLGSYFTQFNAHYEDCYLLSANLLHWGSPKCWILIYPEDLPLFEQLLINLFPTEWIKCPVFIQHKLNFIVPNLLEEAKIRYTIEVQYAGELMVTLPRTVHFGFNLGVNIAEAINIGTVEWIKPALDYIACGCGYYINDKGEDINIKLNMDKYVDNYWPGLTKAHKLTETTTPEQRVSIICQRKKPSDKAPCPKRLKHDNQTYQTVKSKSPTPSTSSAASTINAFVDDNNIETLNTDSEDFLSTATTDLTYSTATTGTVVIDSKKSKLVLKEKKAKELVQVSLSDDDDDDKQLKKISSSLREKYDDSELHENDHLPSLIESPTIIQNKTYLVTVYNDVGKKFDNHNRNGLWYVICLGQCLNLLKELHYEKKCGLKCNRKTCEQCQQCNVSFEEWCKNNEMKSCSQNSINLYIWVYKLYEDYPKIKNLYISLHYMQKHRVLIRQVLEKEASFWK